MDTDGLTMIIEGKTKMVFSDPAVKGRVLIVSKDDITAGDGEKHDVLDGKAVCSTRTTCNVFQLLEREGISTHFLWREDDKSFMAEAVRMRTLELVARRIARGSYLKRNPDVANGTFFDELVFEVFEKDDDNHDPLLVFDFEAGVLRRYQPKQPDTLISEEPIADSRYADVTPELLAELKRITRRTFEVLEMAWCGLNVTLEDFKIECGETGEGRLVVADVVDNDSWRVEQDGVELSKEVYRQGGKSMPDIAQNYHYIAVLSDGLLA